jgi:DNA (cytosine-5)-methyltransferase 1
MALVLIVAYFQYRPFYIETMYAWYILMTPAEAYKEFYKHFYARRRVAQIVIAWAHKRPNDLYPTFLGRFTSRVDMFGHPYVEPDLLNSVWITSSSFVPRWTADES